VIRQPGDRSQARRYSAGWGRVGLLSALYEASLRRDVALIRAHAGTPRHATVLGCFYDIDTGALAEAAKDAGRARQPA
jgi:hypothetical protein